MKSKTPIKIAVFGSAEKPERLEYRERRRAEALGYYFGEIFGDRIEILTGACTGVPLIVGVQARNYGTRVIGYSGESSLYDHLRNPNYADPRHFDELKFLDPKHRILNGLSERSLSMIRDGDAYVFLGGRTGTLTEYLMAFDGSNKPMYVYTGSGGVIDRIPKLRIQKQRKSGRVYETRSAFEIASKLDEDFGICNFQNDPRVLVIHQMSPVSWVQFAHRYESLPNRKVIVRD